MIRQNDSDSYPGAAYYAFEPITAGECCGARSTAALVAACVAAGYAYVFRGGRLWMDVTPAQLTTLCQGALPLPTSFSGDPMTVGAPAHILGTLFGAVEGKLWLTDHGTWGSEAVKVLQVIGMWEDEDIDFDVTKDSLPVAPAKIYGYVETECGAVNPAGLEGTIVDP